MGKTSLELVQALAHDAPLLGAADVLSRTTALPERGIYGWFFKTIPPGCPIEHCVRRDQACLLYLGIAPSRSTSSATIRSRLRLHLTATTYESTLRLSLASLLQEQLDLSFVPAGRSVRLGAGEAVLSKWLHEHALVAVIAHPTPWSVEKDLIALLDLPLNLQHNQHHPFHCALASARAQVRAEARVLQNNRAPS